MKEGRGGEGRGGEGRGGEGRGGETGMKFDVMLRLMMIVDVLVIETALVPHVGLHVLRRSGCSEHSATSVLLSHSRVYFCCRHSCLHISDWL